MDASNVKGENRTSSKGKTGLKNFLSFFLIIVNTIYPPFPCDWFELKGVGQITYSAGIKNKN
jgi:hypothetical protein